MSNPPQNTCENEASTSSPSILLDHMSTFANLSYTSSMRQDFHDSSPMHSTLTVYMEHLTIKLILVLKDIPLSSNQALKAIKRNKSPDYCRELTKSMRRSHNFEDLT